jgi:hypothetical protein
MAILNRQQIAITLREEQAKQGEANSNPNPNPNPNHDMDKAGGESESGSGDPSSRDPLIANPNPNPDSSPKLNPNPNETSTSSSLLKRAKEAEARVAVSVRVRVIRDRVSVRVRHRGLGLANSNPISYSNCNSKLNSNFNSNPTKILKKQMAVMAINLQEGEDKKGEDGPPSVPAEKASPEILSSTGIKPVVVEVSKGKTSAVNPAELRKLHRKIKELEAQLLAGVGTGTGGLTDKKANVDAAKAEKALSRKMKDLESSFRKERAALEGRVAKAEATLEVSSASLPLITAERDQLREKVKRFHGQELEIQALKGKGVECDLLSEQLKQKGRDFDTLAEQFTKESALRKKYKNELEDLKGAIRVYARCRPMVKYEREKGCTQVRIRYYFDFYMLLLSCLYDNIMDFAKSQDL